MNIMNIMHKWWEWASKVNFHTHRFLLKKPSKRQVCGNKFSTHEKYIFRVFSSVVCHSIRSINSRMSMIKAKKQTTKRDSQLRGSGSAIFIGKKISIECLLIDFIYLSFYINMHIYILYLKCNARHKAMYSSRAFIILNKQFA